MANNNNNKLIVGVLILENVDAV